MANVKITFKNNRSEETDYIITDGIYDFNDYLSDNGVEFEEENGTYFITKNDERTGEYYTILSEEETDEELCY